MKQIRGFGSAVRLKSFVFKKCELDKILLFKRRGIPVAQVRTRFNRYANLVIDACRPPLFKSEQDTEGITTMQKQIAISGLFLALCIPFGIARADTVVDQSFTPIINAGGDINECCAFIGQTYSAGLTGTLAGVSVEVREFSGFNFPLNVQIRSVVGGLPTTTILGQTSTTAFSLNDVITFSQSIDQVSGTQYAIVVSFLGAPPAGPGQQVGSWDGAAGNLYPLGDLVASSDGGFTWFIPGPIKTDSSFKTFVQTPEPTSITLLGLGLILASGTAAGKRLLAGRCA